MSPLDKKPRPTFNASFKRNEPGTVCGLACCYIYGSENVLVGNPRHAT